MQRARPREKTGLWVLVVIGVLLLLGAAAFLFVRRTQLRIEHLIKTRWQYMDMRTWQKCLALQELQQQQGGAGEGSVAATAKIVSYDDRNTRDIQSLREVNAQYCKSHGYQFLFFSTYGEDMKRYPPYWLKVKIMLDLMQQEVRAGGGAGGGSGISGSAQYLMWIDSDACFYNHNIPLPTLFPPGSPQFMLCAGDPWATFNAGVWILRVGPQALQFLQKWLNGYDPQQWQLSSSTGTWECLQGKGIAAAALTCRWAGPAYEQGYAEQLLLEGYGPNDIITVHEHILQGASPRPHAFTMHFYGKTRKPLIENFRQSGQLFLPKGASSQQTFSGPA